VAGTETVTLTSQQLPVHTHGAIGAAAAGTTGVPANNFWAADPGGEVAQFSNVAPTAAMSPQAIAPAGGNQPHENIHPFLCISFVIALEGIYPPQN
jgi:microcystin-dependent protein